MVDSARTERRRWKRIDCHGECFWRLALRAPVRIVDIGEGGALLASSGPVPLCDGGRLRVRFAGLPFAANVTLVRRSGADPASQEKPFQLAAVFASLDERSRQVMTRFLKSSGSLPS